MTAQTPGCGTNSEGRKRAALATDPHAGCEHGTCKAGDQWRSVSCAWRGGDVETLIWATFDAAVKAAAPDDPTGHLPNCGYTNVEHETCGCPEYGGRLRAGLRKAITAALDAQPAASQLDRTEWERAVLHEVVATAHEVTTNEPPDYIWAVSTAMLRARGAAPQPTEGGALAEALAAHRHPGEVLAVLGDAWIVCSCGHKIDLPVHDGKVSHEEAARLFEAHQAAALAEAGGLR